MYFRTDIYFHKSTGIMSFANVTVKTAVELENAVHAIFEKALTQVHFCDAYAEVCEELETKCSLQHLTKSSKWDGLIYLSLEEFPPAMVAGPFDSKAAGCKGEELTMQEAPPNLVYDSRSIHDGKLFKVWKYEAEYYVSTPTVLCGPYDSRYAALCVRDVHPVRTVLLQCCQCELGGSVNQRMNKVTAEKVKQRKLGTCHFLGALFRRGFVGASTMRRCMEVLLEVRQNIAGELDLLNPHAAPNEVNLEALCTLLETRAIGERLESQSKDPLVSKYYWVLKSNLNGNVQLSSKLATRVQTLIDLRANKWDANGMEKDKTCKEIVQTVGRKRARDG